MALMIPSNSLKKECAAILESMKVSHPTSLSHGDLELLFCPFAIIYGSPITTSTTILSEYWKRLKNLKQQLYTGWNKKSAIATTAIGSTKNLTVDLTTKVYKYLHRIQCQQPYGYL